MSPIFKFFIYYFERKSFISQVGCVKYIPARAKFYNPKIWEDEHSELIYLDFYF